ncbi:MAG TPA: type II toxin-antitoxin system PemK/MazF family toxin [Candidatus Babeliales bacterium]|nr:type II toxin-antitoxin system PemK/MazF family toxin [Candidatus Babeliales bacterium]
MKNTKRGEVYWVNLDPSIGKEIKKTRPALIISNDLANQYSSRVIVAPITSNIQNLFPFEVAIELNGKKGKIMLDQIRSIDKIRLGKKIDTCDLATIRLVNRALEIVLAL